MKIEDIIEQIKTNRQIIEGFVDGIKSQVWKQQFTRIKKIHKMGKIGCV
jgi:hypothetical protein